MNNLLFYGSAIVTGLLLAFYPDIKVAWRIWRARRWMLRGRYEAVGLCVYCRKEVGVLHMPKGGSIGLVDAERDFTCHGRTAGRFIQFGHRLPHA